MPGKFKPRQLNSDFILALKSGSLSSILEIVHKDPTLDLNIRNNYINIYYRGGNILKITLDKARGYLFHFDKKYCIDSKSTSSSILVSLCTKGDWYQYFPLAKQVMDFYLKEHPKEEREYAQLVVRDNNYSKVSNSTDYFIIDYEFDNHRRARFDLVTVEWTSGASMRKSPNKFKPKLVVMEMKYGDGALKGTAGMVKHVDDFLAFLGRPGDVSSFRKEMVTLFKQKRELGLIRFGKKGNPNAIEEFDENIDLVFLLANHDPDKSVLNEMICDIQKRYPGFNVKAITASYLGYGLYKDNLIVLTCEEQVNPE